MNKSVKYKFFDFLRRLFQTAFIVGVILASVIPFSCKVTTEGIQIIGGNYTPPVIESVKVVDEQTIRIDFSESVFLKNIVVSPFIPGISDSENHSGTEALSYALAAANGEKGKLEAEVESQEEGKTHYIHLQEKTSIGKQYEVFGSVEDRIGNTLTFCIPFTGFNSKIPQVIMTEIQIKYQKATVKGEVIYRGEYVEFLALTDGNLAGLELISAADGNEKNYEFPPLDVKKGEVFLVHLRAIGEGCVNEDSECLDLATAPHSKDGVRDLWGQENLSHFNDTSDVIMLRNMTDNSIIDAVMYAGAGVTEWKTTVAESAVRVYESGLYPSYETSSATCSAGCTPLKSLTRVDSKELYDLVMDNEEYDFPVLSDESAWCVMPASPGVL